MTCRYIFARIHIVTLLTALLLLLSRCPENVEIPIIYSDINNITMYSTSSPVRDLFLRNVRISMLLKVNVKWSRYIPGVVQRVGRGIALLFHDRGTRRGWVVSSTPRPHFNPGKDPVPILQEAGWVPGPVWTGGKSRPHRDSIPDRPARSQSLYRLSYQTHN